MLKGLERLVLILGIIVLLLSPLVEAGVISIKIPEKVEIKQPWIRLGNIAEIKGPEGVDLKGLKSLKLGKAPAPGYEREIPRQLISLSLQDKGYDLSEFKLEMPPETVVRTAWQEIKGVELISFASQFIKDHLDSKFRNVEIISRFTPPDLKIPDADYKLAAVVDNLEKLPGDISLEIQICINDRVIKKVYLGLTVKIVEKVYVARQNLLKGEKIKKEDFKLELKELEKLNGELIKDFKHPLIKEGIVNIPINKGEVLTSYYLKKPILISWGDEIQAEVVIGNVRVSTMVKARQSGKKGDYIQVENPQSGYRFKAQVINSHLVRLIRY